MMWHLPPRAVRAAGMARGSVPRRLHDGSVPLQRETQPAAATQAAGSQLPGAVYRPSAPALGGRPTVEQQLLYDRAVAAFEQKSPEWLSAHLRGSELEAFRAQGMMLLSPDKLVSICATEVVQRGTGRLPS